MISFIKAHKAASSDGEVGWQHGISTERRRPRPRITPPRAAAAR